MLGRNCSGSTPIMLAVNGQCGEVGTELLELMLAHGGIDTLVTPPCPATLS